MASPASTENSLQRGLPERRVTLYNVSWHAYEQILVALGDDRAAHSPILRKR